MDICANKILLSIRSPYTELQVATNEATSLKSAVPHHSVPSCKVVGTGQCAPRTAVESLKHSGTEQITSQSPAGTWISTHNRLVSFRQMAKNMGETAARPGGGSRHFKIDDAMRDMLLIIIESDPYSPFLNPIENMFSVFKVDFK